MIFKRFSLFIVLLLLSLCVGSCSFLQVKSYIYTYESDLTLIFSDNTLSTEAQQELYTALSNLKSSPPQFSSDASAKEKHEIVVGKSSRQISNEAYTKLEQIPDGDLLDEFNFLIYSNGESVAIAYDIAEEEIYDTGVIGTVAVRYFIENYLTDEELILDSGVVYRGKISLDDYYAENDARIKDSEWESLREAAGEYGDEIVAGLKALYTNYDGNMISWVAELYDPGIGGYYYSNSARDTYGYLPDIESTAHALSLMNGSGIRSYIHKGLTDVLPSEMQTQIIKFAKGLQDPGGYFYHPQWGTNITSSRRSRDLARAVNVLATFGSRPTYNTPNGDLGDGIRAEDIPVSYSSLTSQLSQSALIAVSKVIPTAHSTDYPPELENRDSFEAYLGGLKISTDSYYIGNTLTAMKSQIKQRDKDLRAAGADYSLLDILINWLNENQNVQNGTWDADTDYYAVNGLMKICGIYNFANVALPNLDKAMQSAICAITSDEAVLEIVDIYNPWHTISALLSNAKNYGDVDSCALVEATRGILYDNITPLFDATSGKVAIFKKADGSFSYKPDASADHSQGAKVAVPGTNEGDLNATVIASTDLLGMIYSCFGLSQYEIAPFGHSEFRDFISITKSAFPIKKEPLPISRDPITFDEESVGYPPENITYKSSSAAVGGSILVLEDTREGTDGNVLKISSRNPGYDYVTIGVSGSDRALSCNVFEADMCVASSDSSYPIQIQMGNSYFFSIRTKNGKLNIVEASSANDKLAKVTPLGLTPEFNEWFNVRVEFYKGDRNTVRIKFYYNGTLAAVTDNFYDSDGGKLTDENASPSSSYSKVTIAILKTASCDMYLDNIKAYKADMEYEAVTDPEAQPPINIDAPTPPDNQSFDHSEHANAEICGTHYNFSSKIDESTPCAINESTE